MELKLKDWTNKDKVGTRFPQSQTKCPLCNQNALEDKWPPDYGSGATGGEFSRFEGSQKYICLNCKVAFRVSYKKETKNGEIIVDETKYSETVPLIEQDGYLLTPHDVWRENYKKENGEYPKEIYA